MTADSAPSGYYASRPTLRLNGQEQDELGNAVLQSLLVEETTRGLFRCEATFLNWGTKNGTVDFLFFDRQLLDFGKVFSVEFGPPGQSGPVFAGRITGIEGIFPPQRPPEVLILAEDRFQDLRMTRRTRSFEDVSDADVIRQIASQNGLTAQVDVDGPTHRVMAQVNQSDLAFLRERATAVDAELWIDDRTLYAQARARRNSGSVTLTYAENLLEFTVLADLAHQRTSVNVSGWDVSAKAAIDEQADENDIQAELNGGTGGSSVLGQALAERRERVATAVPLTQAEATKLAQARYRARARRFLSGIGTADGNPKLRVGSIVDIENVGPLFSGSYFVRLTRHTFDLDHGYRTAFEVERPGLGG